MDSLYSILKFYRILLNFILFINIYPDHIHAMPWKGFKNSSFINARLCVTKTILSLQLAMNGTFL